MKEDAGRGYRRVVASPKPAEIVESGCDQQSLVDSGQISNLPAVAVVFLLLRQGRPLQRAQAAVIDKDFAS